MDTNKKAIEVFDKNANLYQKKFMDVSLYKDTLDFFCQNIQIKNPKLLEVGCGPGNLTNYILNKRPDFEILGTDMAPNMIALAKKNVPKASFRIMDGKFLNELKEKYDSIICGFLFPYFSKQETLDFIVNCSKIINTYGLLYISTMEGNNQLSGFKKGSTGDEIYTYFHQEDYLREALEQNEFKIELIKRKNYIHNQENTTDLIIIAKKLK